MTAEAISEGDNCQRMYIKNENFCSDACYSYITCDSEFIISKGVGSLSSEPEGCNSVVIGANRIEVCYICHRKPKPQRSKVQYCVSLIITCVWLNAY